MWRDWTMQQQHNEMYQKQIQSSYYQLQYLQQQQMIMMLNSNNSSRRSSTISSAASTASTISSSRHYRPNIPQYYQLSPSSSSTSSSIKHLYKSEKSRTNRASINSTTSTINSAATMSVETQLPKRRQSLGKRIKKVFGMTETTTRSTLLSVEVPADKTTSPASTKISPSTTHSLKKKGRFIL